jgi:hypothetical protein
MNTMETGTERGFMEEGEALLGGGMDTLRRAMDRLELFVRDRPGVALLGAIGLGFVIGRIVRR